jgi:opacity protein-like surface antigen
MVWRDHRRQRELLKTRYRPDPAGSNARVQPDIRVNHTVILTSAEESDTAFALLGGAGLDYQLKRTFAVRVAADYIRSYFFRSNPGQSPRYCRHRF